MAIKNNAESVLIIPGDIPLLTPHDIDSIFINEVNAPIMVISPSLRKNGTNLLFLKPPNIIKIEYGEDSFRKHINIAKKRKIPNIIVHNSKNIELDIDLQEDLFLFLEQTSSTFTYQYLKQLNF